MAHNVDELLRDTVDEPTRSIDAAKVVERARHKTRVVRAGVGLGAIACLAVVSMVAIPVISGSDMQPEIADRPATDDIENDPAPSYPSERAPEAGTDASHWPVELIYTPRGDESLTGGRMLRFRGTSWARWTIEESWPDEATLSDGRWTEPAGPGVDASDSWVEDGTRWRGVSADLHAQWRSAVGLHQRVVVGLDRIPGGQELVESLGLTPDEVEAYATPNIAECTSEMSRCAPDDSNAARGIAHLATGFPLFAEERYDGGPEYVWLRAEAFSYGDSAKDAIPPTDTDDD